MVRNIVFNRVSPGAICSSEVVKYLLVSLPKELLPEYPDVSVNQKGHHAYDVQRGTRLFIVEHDNFGRRRNLGTRDSARFRIIDGSIKISDGLVKRVKSVLKSEHPAVCKNVYYPYSH
jgi:hypothetical protein